MARLNYSESISILGLNAGASPEEIKDAYRKLAKQYHPDVYQLDKGEKFLNVSLAYQFLRKNPSPLYQENSQKRYSNVQERDQKKRRTYHTRKRATKRQEAQQKAEMFKWLFSKINPAVYAILFFNLLLATDYLLPPIKHEVEISRIYTVEYRNYRSYSKSHRNYSYKAILNNGMEFKFNKKEMGKIDTDGVYILERSQIFRETEKLTHKKNNEQSLHQEFGLFSVFGFLIPATILLSLSYFYLIKNNDYRLTIFLVVLIVAIIQLFLIF